MNSSAEELAVNRERDGDAVPFVRVAKYAGSLIVLGIAFLIIWTRAPYNDFTKYGRVGDYIISISIVCSPAIYWECVCRITPRPDNVLVAGLSSALRIALFVPTAVYSQLLLLPGYAMLLHSVGAGSKWSPTVYQGMAIGVAVAAALLAGIDYSAARLIFGKPGRSGSA